MSRHHATMAAAVMFGMLPLQAIAAQQDTVEYAVKFVCGERRSILAGPPSRVYGTVSPGRYFTAINVHNPWRDSVIFSFKVAATGGEPVGGAIHAGSSLVLVPDQALEIDCSDILRLAGEPRFLKGFVVIQGAVLDVVAVYTAGQEGRVETMDVERVAPRRASSASP